MDAIKQKEDLYLSGFFVDLLPNVNSIDQALNQNMFFDLSYLSPILVMKNIISSDFAFAILAAILIVLVSTITFLALTFISKDKYKEIAVLKSFGTPKKNITGLFLLLNFFIAGISIVLGLAAATISQYFINQMFMSSTVFSINYSIINTTPLSFIIVVLTTLLAAIISTFLALRKVNSIDVALALKMY